MSLTRRAIALFAAIAVFSISNFASAQDAPPYFVVTGDGSQYQGQLVENIVGQHVTIRLASGEIRTFAAADVRSQGSLPATPVIVPLANEPVRYGGPDAVLVHITKSNDGEGSLFMESASGWQRVCVMPCTTTVDPKIDYKLYNSDAFRFPAGPRLDLVAQSGGGRTLHAIGWTLVTASLVSWIPGLLFQVGAFDDSSARTAAELAAMHRSDNVTAGVIYGVTGALLVAGIVMVSLHPSATLGTADGLRRIAERGGIPLGSDLTLTPTGLAF